MQAMVNPMVCQGHAMCVGLVADVFALAGNHRAYTTVDEVPEHLREAVRHAASSCPEGAIIVVD